MKPEELDFPATDAHVHLYPDRLAGIVTPALAERFGNGPAFDGTVAGCKAKDAVDGIAASINLPVATKPDNLGGFGMWDEVEETLVGEPVYRDLAHTFFWAPDEVILRIIQRHGAERIPFGTDAPWQDPGKVLDAFLSLPLDGRARRLICHDNAAGLLRISMD